MEVFELWSLVLWREYESTKTIEIICAISKKSIIINVHKFFASFYLCGIPLFAWRGFFFILGV
jgi:hypothetical protein